MADDDLDSGSFMLGFMLARLPPIAGPIGRAVKRLFARFAGAEKRARVEAEQAEVRRRRQEIERSREARRLEIKRRREIERRRVLRARASAQRRLGRRIRKIVSLCVVAALAIAALALIGAISQRSNTVHGTITIRQKF